MCVPADAHISPFIQCRQKTVEVKAKCGSCTLWWCPACLLNRYGEEVDKVGFPAASKSSPSLDKAITFVLPRGHLFRVKEIVNTECRSPAHAIAHRWEVPSIHATLRNYITPRSPLMQVSKVESWKCPRCRGLCNCSNCRKVRRCRQPRISPYQVKQKMVGTWASTIEVLKGCA